MMQGRERETMRQLTSDFNVENLQRDKKNHRLTTD